MVARVAILISLWTINLVLFFHMVWGEGGIIVYRDLKRTYSTLEQEIASIDSENLALSREIRLLQTDKQYVEKMIRERLHYVRENELLYLFSSDKDAAGGTIDDDGKN